VAYGNGLLNHRWRKLPTGSNPVTSASITAGRVVTTAVSYARSITGSNPVPAFENLSKNNKFDESSGIDYSAKAYR
jgi:hypothetical protein